MSIIRINEQILETKPCRYGTISYFKTDLVIGRSLSQYGEWAQAEIEFLLGFVNSGDTVIDAGAFIGTHTLAFAQMVGPSGKVYAFEPHPISFKILERNVSQNALKNVFRFNIALSDTAGTIRVSRLNNFTSDNPGMFSIAGALTEYPSLEEALSIETTVLDEIKLERCNLIKLDVEGMELNVLQGARGTLRRFRPLVLAECLSADNAWKAVELMLVEGFRAFLHNVASYNPENYRNNLENFFGEARETNLFFVPEEKVLRLEQSHTNFKFLIPIYSIDDLVLGLLKKPQYKYEVLSKSAAAKVVGNDFWANEIEVKQFAERDRILSRKIVELDDNLRDLKNHLDKNREASFAMAREISKLRKQLAASYEQMAEKEQAMQALSAQVAEKEQVVRALSAQVTEKEQMMATIQAQLTTITSSTPWKLTQMLWGIRVALAPLGSRRDRIVLCGMRALRMWQRQGGWFLLRKIFKKIAQGLRLDGLKTSVDTTAIRLEQSAQLSLPAEGFPGLHGHLDKVTVTNGCLSLVGWIFHESYQVEYISLIVKSAEGTERFRARYGQNRADVYSTYRVARSLKSGFWITVNLQQRCRFYLSLEVQCLGLPSYQLPLGTIIMKRPSKFLGLAGLIKKINRRRIRIALHYVRNGNWRYIFHWLQEELKYDTRTKGIRSLGKVLDLMHVAPLPPLRPLDKEVDIIVPVYNGYHLLPTFFENILANTSGPYRLLIIDDCSSDPRVWPYLQSIAARRSNLVLLRNSENKGFVATVNVGIRHTLSHFVILNTDVLVPPKWLERLMQPILSEKDIATSTPFTNSGTICSFPRFLMDNPLFEGLSVEEIDKVFAQVNIDRAKFDIPTGVGFCMGMNRDVIEKIGGFDETTFGKGYGEENDWCMRAHYRGYRHVMAANLFVYHKHGGSFPSDEKQKLLTRNLDHLYAKHPEYSYLVERYIKNDPVSSLRDLLLIMLASRFATEGAILIVDHELGGGANMYRDRIIGELQKESVPVFLYVENRVKGTAQLRFSYKDYLIQFDINNLSELVRLTNLVRLREIFYNNAVSFHEPRYIPDLLVELKRVSSARLVIAIHDFFPVCPSYNLLNDKGVYCGIPDVVECKKCLVQNNFADATSLEGIEEWRRSWWKCLDEANVVLCFSNNSAELLRRAYPGLDVAKIVIRPHKVDYMLTLKPQLYEGPEIRIGVVGAIGYEKGASIIEAMARLIRERKIPAKLLVIGRLSGDISSDVVSVTGPYNRQELPRIIDELGISVFFFPSIGPETFSYVVEELIQMEVPLAVFNIGAPAERVAQYPFGKIIERIDAETALDALFDLHQQMRSRKSREWLALNQEG